MHVDLAIVKQEADIDDTKIKLELDKELSDNSTMQISWGKRACNLSLHTGGVCVYVCMYICANIECLLFYYALYR